ncbi:hypothetical protein K0M31_014942 [Melipona bicolor]|uniref:Protein kinase domain-containing protein n=1 Tax=Melipona bicolor TaxID=60889 RepID=A0AA40FGL0_9HYME|nr:hypothetical protein K0M31_014942 [Melipona bicolor]
MYLIGDQVAAKVMQTEKCSSTLIREKRASLLRHSNIVKVLMIEQGASLSLITMELCGTTLQDYLDKTILIKAKRICILKDVACALQFCHNAGIVHADVKPKNILMSANGQSKLTDFGCSVLIQESNEIDKFHVCFYHHCLIILIILRMKIFFLGDARVCRSRGNKGK